MGDNDMKTPNASNANLSLVIALLVCAASLFVAPQARAGSLAVNPIRLTLSESSPTGALTLENTGGTTMVLQLQLMRWSATQADDHYEPSEDLVATPPIMKIGPGATQTIRVGLAGAVEGKRELSYRLFIEEVPPPAESGYPGLQVALRLGVPVFVEPVQKTEPALDWRAVKAADGSLALQVSNRGSAHLRLIRLRLNAAGDADPLAIKTVAQYLLPGQQRQIPLKMERPLAARHISVSAETDHGPIDVALDVESP